MTEESTEEPSGNTEYVVDQVEVVKENRNKKAQNLLSFKT